MAAGASPWAFGTAGLDFLTSLIPKTTTTNVNQNSGGTQNQNFQQAGTTTPTYTSPFQGELENQMLSQASNSLKNPFDTSGFASNALKNINTGADVNKTILQNTLAARGLGQSPIAASATASQEQSRVAQGTDFLNQLPMLQEQIYNQRLNNALNVFRSAPLGSSTSSDGSSSTDFQNWLNSITKSKTGIF